LKTPSRQVKTQDARDGGVVQGTHQENSNVLFLTYFFFFVSYYKFKARKRQPISSFFFLFIKGRKRQ